MLKFIITFCLCINSFVYASSTYLKPNHKRTQTEAFLEDEGLRKKFKYTSPLSIKDIQLKVSLALQGNKESQQSIVDYFQTRLTQDLFLSSSEEIDILRQLNLELWSNYFTKFHESFLSMCLGKAIHDLAWHLPKELEYHIREEVKNHNTVAQLMLGMIYDFGIGVPQNYKEAFYWYMCAAQKGNIKAQFNVGTMLLKGEGVIQDYPQGIAWLKSAARSNHKGSQLRLGFIYYNGEGVSVDYYQAFNWLKSAADQRHSSAQYNVGIMLLKGEGTPQDYFQAFKYIELASMQGYPKAQYTLGLMYEKGQGIQASLDKAIYWYMRAAKNGSDEAQQILKNILVPKQSARQKNSDYLLSLETFKAYIQNLSCIHSLEMKLFEMEDFFFSPSYRNTTILSYYQSFIRFENKILHILEDFSWPGYMLTGWQIKNTDYQVDLYDNEQIYKEYHIKGESYLCLGNDNVKKGQMLNKIVNNEDDDWKTAYCAAKSLEDILNNAPHTLIRRPSDYQQMRIKGISSSSSSSSHKVMTTYGLNNAAYNQESIDQHILDKYRQRLQSLKALPEELCFLLKNGASHRNYIFAEEYLFME